MSRAEDTRALARLVAEKARKIEREAHECRALARQLEALVSDTTSEEDTDGKDAHTRARSPDSRAA